MIVRRLQAVVEADGVSNFESKIGNAGAALTTFKQTVAATGGAMGVLAATGFAVAVNEARKFEQAMVEVEKVTNPETARAMSQSIRDMAETIPIAQQKLADIAADAGRFGVQGEKAISKFTRATAKMATATNLNTKDAGEAFARLATLTQTPISKVENLGSSINKLSNNFATSAQEIVDSMLRSAGAMKQFGLRQTDIAAFSASLNEVSESSERAGTRLRRLMQELSNPKKIKEMASALGMNVKEYKRMKKNNPRKLLMQMIKGFKKGGKTANSLKKSLSTTSRQALTGLSQNLKGLRESLGMSRKAFKRNQSLQKEFRKASKTLNAELKVLLNRVRNVALRLGKMFLPAIKNVVKWINTGVKRFQKMNKRFEGVVLPATLAATAITGIGTALYFLSGAITVAKLAALGTGIGAVLIAVTALTAAISALALAWKNNWMGIRTKTKKAIAFLKGAFNSFMSFMGKLKKDAQVVFNAIRKVVMRVARRITKAWNNQVIPMVNSTRKTFNRIKNQIQSTLNFIQNQVIRPVLGWIETQWNKHGTVIVKEARKTWNAISKRINQALNTIRTTVQPWINWLQGAWRNFMNRLRHDAKVVWNGVKSDVKWVMDGIKWIISGVLSTIQSLWKQNGDQIISIVSFFLDAIKGNIEFMFNAIRTVIVTTLRLLRGDVDGAMQEIDRFFTSTFNGIKGFLDHWGGKLISWATGTFNSAKRTVSDILIGLKNTVKNKVSSMLSDVKSNAQNWISGFTKPFRKAKERVLDQFNKLKDKVVGNSIVPDMLGQIMSETGDWKGSFQGDFRAAAEGSEKAMKSMPSELELPTPRGMGTSRNRGTVNQNNVKIDVSVPQGVDTDTAARTIADEVKSRAFND